MASTLILASFLGIAIAQTTTLSIPFYGFDTQSIDASIVAANPTATTMKLACPPGTDGSDCGLFPYMTLIYGPSTYHMDSSVDGDGFTGTADCSRGARAAVCTEFASGSEANFPGTTTTTYDGEDPTLPVRVTAGAEKLGSAQATVTGSASGSASQSQSGSATSGGAVSTTTASVTQISGTQGASASRTVQSGAPSATPSTGAATFNSVFLYGGLFGAAVGLCGGLIL